MHIGPTLRNSPAVISVCLLLACGDSNGPSIPQVAGQYTLTASLDSLTCDSIYPPPGGTVILTAFSQTYGVRLDQQGTSLSEFELGASTADGTGTIDAGGAISLHTMVTFQEAPRAGNRIFFVDLTIDEHLQVQPSGQITGSMAITDVFHEGSSTAPIFATCTRQGTEVLVPQ